MKYLLIGIVIGFFLAFSISSKPYIQPCSNDLVCRYFLNGKFVKSATYDGRTFFSFHYPIKMRIRDGKWFQTDSIIISNKTNRG
jgi:hypothetical protein